MKCFACDGQIRGSYKVIYCVPEHYSKEQLKEGGGVLGKLIDLIGGPAKFSVKIEQGRKPGMFDRFIGVSPRVKQYTRWREVKEPKARKRGLFGSPFGQRDVYKCYLHVACHQKYIDAKTGGRLEENFFHGFEPPEG